MDYCDYYNTALRKGALPDGSFDRVGKKGTHQVGHVALLFSANQIRGLKSVRQIIEERFFRKLFFQFIDVRMIRSFIN